MVLLYPSPALDKHIYRYVLMYLKMDIEMSSNVCSLTLMLTAISEKTIMTIEKKSVSKKTEYINGSK